MNKDLMLETHKNAVTKKIPEIKTGYTIEVDTIIREGAKERIQKFKGLVIAITGNGSNKLVTVRKVSNGVGVEKKLPLNSPNVGEIKVIKTEITRRSKLYFMRERVGKNAMRIKKGKAIFVTDEMGASEIESLESDNEVVNNVDSITNEEGVNSTTQVEETAVETTQVEEAKA